MRATQHLAVTVQNESWRCGHRHSKALSLSACCLQLVWPMDLTMLPAAAAPPGERRVISG